LHFQVLQFQSTRLAMQHELIATSLASCSFRYIMDNCAINRKTFLFSQAYGLVLS